MYFSRSIFTELWITLSSNEQLGVLDSDYIEDYYEVDGQVSFYNVDTGTRVPILMNELTPDPTPSVAHDVFTGYITLSSIPNGVYQVQGRVRDILGNYTILSAVDTPLGGERLITLQFEVGEAPSGVVVIIGPLKLSGGVTATTKLSGDVQTDTSFQSNTPAALVETGKDINFSIKMQSTVNISTKLQEL
jgi:hypothetical protein